MLAACDGMESWPAVAKPWVAMQLSQGDTGVEAMAEAFVQDSQGGFQVQAKSLEFKAAVKAKLLASGFKERLYAGAQQAGIVTTKWGLVSGAAWRVAKHAWPLAAALAVGWALGSRRRG